MSLETVQPESLAPSDLALIGRTCLGHAARRAANLVTRVYNQHLLPSGLEVTQFSILCSVGLGHATSASELADIIGVERSTLARNLDRLAKAGLVAAEPGDGRRIVHRLTAQGTRKLAEAMPLWRTAQGAMLEHLPHSKDETIRDDLQLLRRAARTMLSPGT